VHWTTAFLHLGSPIFLAMSIAIGSKAQSFAKCAIIGTTEIRIHLLILVSFPFHCELSRPDLRIGLPRVTFVRLQKSYQTFLYDLDNAPEFQNLSEADLLNVRLVSVIPFLF
jgi:hypothetical protein